MRVALIMVALAPPPAFALTVQMRMPDAPVALPISFSDAIRSSDGQLLLVNQGGALFRTDRQPGALLKPYGKPLGRPVSSLIEAADGSLIMAGFTGVTRVSPPTVTASE